MSQFKVGGKVVAAQRVHVENSCGESIIIEKGSILPVFEVRECDCGTISLDLGFTSRKAKDPNTQCYVCKAIEKTRVWYLAAKYFVPIEEQEFKQVEYTKILEQIPACAQ